MPCDVVETTGSNAGGHAVLAGGTVHQGTVRANKSRMTGHPQECMINLTRRRSKRPYTSGEFLSSRRCAVVPGSNVDTDKPGVYERAKGSGAVVRRTSG